MADSYDVDRDGNYQETKTYKDASAARRRQFNKYKKESNISDEHMFLLMMQMDLDSVPEEKRKGDSTKGQMLLVVGCLLFLGTIQSATSTKGTWSIILVLVALAAFGITLFMYYTGFFNPYKSAVKEVKKRLKDMPEVPSFVDWDVANPSKEDRKAAKMAKRKRAY